MTKIWFAKEAVVKIDSASDITIDTSAALDTFFSSATAIEGQMKDITFKQPMGDVDLINLHGTDANGYQNAEGEEKPAVLGEISGTLIVPGDELMMGEIFGSGTDIASTHTRYNPGKASMTRIAMLLNLDDSTDEFSIAVDNAWTTEFEVKSTGADGHFEATVTMKCLPRDWYGPEFKD
jgi:hypothetical protein